MESELGETMTKRAKPAKSCGRYYGGEILKWRNESTRSRRITNRLRRAAKHRVRQEAKLALKNEDKDGSRS
jgi:hypothetical protein